VSVCVSVSVCEFVFLLNFVYNLMWPFVFKSNLKLSYQPIIQLSSQEVLRASG
jgi:hypothetical protein